ncbi:MAG: hypothetical protein WC327_01815 [Candidatus Cloacimonadia bacterium]
MSQKRVRKARKKDTVCQKCQIKLEAEQLFCFECGEPTSVLRDDLSALNNIKEVWSKFKGVKGSYFPFSIFYIIVILLPLFAIIFLTHNNYWLNNLSLLIFLPLVFIPFNFDFNDESGSGMIGRYFRSLAKYPTLFLFTLFNILFLLILKYVCTSVDPILNLVRLIMVLYWLSVVVPLPFVLLRKGLSPLKALKVTYKGGKETRWQQFFTYLLLALINIAGLIPIGLGLLVTIPFSYAVLERYYLQMDKYNLFGKDVEL